MRPCRLSLMPYPFGSVIEELRLLFIQSSSSTPMFGLKMTLVQVSVHSNGRPATKPFSSVRFTSAANVLRIGFLPSPSY